VAAAQLSIGKNKKGFLPRETAWNNTELPSPAGSNNSCHESVWVVDKMQF
jgi:hypothetical protein